MPSSGAAHDLSLAGSMNGKTQMNIRLIGPTDAIEQRASVARDDISSPCHVAVRPDENESSAIKRCDFTVFDTFDVERDGQRLGTCMKGRNRRLVGAKAQQGKSAPEQIQSRT